MASASSASSAYHTYYPLPPVTDISNNNQNSRPTSAQSPWSATSQSSADHLSLTLPSLSPPFTPGELAADASLFDRLHSPSAYIPEPLTAPQHSQPQHPPPALLQARLQAEIYRNSDATDLFLNFEDGSQPQSPQAPITRASSIVDLTESSIVTMEDLSRKRRPGPGGEDSQTPLKRRRGVTPVQAIEGSNKQPMKSENSEVEELDMVEIDNDQKLEDFRKKQQADLISQQNRERADKPVKLTEFQCIICLDSPTDLTVTHCGHLFCSLCLHEALHAGTQKKTCPVCRQQINTTKNREGKPQKNGVFVLEMKLMTARRKEKQPQDAWK